MIFETTPPSYSSVNESLVYVVNDAHAADAVTYPNYKYVYEVWINGTKQFTGKVFPHPTTFRGIIDIGAVVREYVQPVLNPTTGLLAQEFGEGKFSVSIVVKIREEYSGTIGAVVLTDSTRVFFNHYNGRFYDFTILGSFVAKPTSNRGLKLDLSSTTNYYFLPYFSATTTPFNITVTQSGVTRTKIITPTAINTLQLFNISLTAINAATWDAVYSNITAGVYTVSVGGVSYTVNIVCSGLYTNYPLHFMNKFGGFETMLFNKARKRSIDIERKEWQQLPYRVNGSGVASLKSGIIMNSQRSILSSSFKNKMRINTDLLFDADYVWLAELLSSPLVYLEDGGYFYPIIITNNNYEIKETLVDNATNLTIDIDFGRQFKTQYQ